MDLREFDFDLPPELIAHQPTPDRASARLLYVDRAARSLTHSRVTALPGLLRSGDLLVVNNTRVFPARLLGHRVPSGGAVECLLVRELESEGSDPSNCYEALMHPGQKLHPGARLMFDGTHAIHGEVLQQRFF